MTWSLAQLLAGLHDDIERRLVMARDAFGHTGTKGNASESVWIQLFETYLPKRYQAASAHVVDSKGMFSHQIDVVLFDRQYSPFIFHFEGQIIVPVESVYAVFEAKQTVIITPPRSRMPSKRLPASGVFSGRAFPYRTPAAHTTRSLPHPSSAAFSRLKATGIQLLDSPSPTRSRAAIRPVGSTWAVSPPMARLAAMLRVATASFLTARPRPRSSLT